ncbi:MAG: hypothetical protein WC551_01800 [Patescibacteria group bacterium]
MKKIATFRLSIGFSDEENAIQHFMVGDSVFCDVERYYEKAVLAQHAKSSLAYGTKIAPLFYGGTMFMWAVYIAICCTNLYLKTHLLHALLTLAVMTLPVAIFCLVRRRFLKKPADERRTPSENQVLVDPLVRYACAIIDAVVVLNSDLGRWNAYVDALAAGMQSVTRDDEGLHATLVSRRETLIAHAKKFTFLCANRSAKTKAVGFPELAAKVSEAEKEFSAVEPAVTAGVYREQIQGPVSELEELRKSGNRTGVRVEAAALQAGATPQPEEDADREDASRVLVTFYP